MKSTILILFLVTGCTTIGATSSTSDVPFRYNRCLLNLTTINFVMNTSPVPDEKAISDAREECSSHRDLPCLSSVEKFPDGSFTHRCREMD